MKFLLLLSTVLGATIIALYLTRLGIITIKRRRIKKDLNHYREFFGQLVEELIAKTITEERVDRLVQTQNEQAMKRIVLEIISIRRGRQSETEITNELNWFANKATVSDMMNMPSEDKRIVRNIGRFMQIVNRLPKD